MTKMTLLLMAFCPAMSFAQKPTQVVRYEDRIRILEAKRLKQTIGNAIWPDWEATPFVVLLVSGTDEFLFFHPKPTADFRSLGYDSLLQTDVHVRPARYPGTFLATFPAVGGLQTIVVGTPEQTGKSTTSWIVTLMHEHFHQYQYGHSEYYSRSSRLNLSDGDQTGMWMLNYPFPYEDPSVVSLLNRLLEAEREALRSPGLLRDYLEAKRALRCALVARDYRYLNFQLWQEGLSTYTEIRVAELAASRHSVNTEIEALPDYKPFEVVARDLKEGVMKGLRDPNLQKRVVFYSIGAGEGLLLDTVDSRWRNSYFDTWFDTDILFELSNHP